MDSYSNSSHTHRQTHHQENDAKIHISFFLIVDTPHDSSYSNSHRNASMIRGESARRKILIEQKRISGRIQDLQYHIRPFFDHKTLHNDIYTYSYKSRKSYIQSTFFIVIFMVPYTIQIHCHQIYWIHKHKDISYNWNSCSQYLISLHPGIKR